MHPVDLRNLMTATRALAEHGTCATHGETYPAIGCAPCRADLAAEHDAAGLAAHRRITTMHACDQRFPKRFRDATAEHPDVRDWVDRTINDPGTGDSLLLLGPVGRGKTSQAYGALRAVLADRPDLTWQATSDAEFAAAMRVRPGSDPEQVLDRHRNAGLLLLDDIGTAKTSEWVEEVTYRLVSHRYDQMLPTIYVTNFDPADLRHAIGDRIASRLSEICDRVVIDGPDRRRTLRAVV